MDWTEILVVSIPALLVFAGVVVNQMGKREEKRMEKERDLEERVGKLESKLDKVQRYLRREQEFSHNLVLVLQGVSRYLRETIAYRSLYENQLPAPPPLLPNVEEIDDLLKNRPSYDED